MGGCHLAVGTGLAKRGVPIKLGMAGAGKIETNNRGCDPSVAGRQAISCFFVRTAVIIKLLFLRFCMRSILPALRINRSYSMVKGGLSRRVEIFLHRALNIFILVASLRIWILG